MGPRLAVPLIGIAKTLRVGLLVALTDPAKEYVVVAQQRHRSCRARRRARHFALEPRLAVEHPRRVDVAAPSVTAAEQRDRLGACILTSGAAAVVITARAPFANRSARFR